MLKSLPLALALALVALSGGRAFAGDDTAPERSRRGGERTESRTDDHREERGDRDRGDARRGREEPRRVEPRDDQRDHDVRDRGRDERASRSDHDVHHDHGHGHRDAHGRPPVRVVERPVIVRRRDVTVVRRPAVRVVHVHGHDCKFVPGKWGYRLREVVEPGYYEVVHTEPVYELRWDDCRRVRVRVLVRPGGERRVWVPPRTVTRRVRVWIPRHYTCGHHPH